LITMLSFFVLDSTNIAAYPSLIAQPWCVGDGFPHFCPADVLAHAGDGLFGRGNGTSRRWRNPLTVVGLRAHRCRDLIYQSKWFVRSGQAPARPDLRFFCAIGMRLVQENRPGRRFEP